MCDRVCKIARMRKTKLYVVKDRQKERAALCNNELPSCAALGQPSSRDREAAEARKVSSDQGSYITDAAKVSTNSSERHRHFTLLRTCYCLAEPG